MKLAKPEIERIIKSEPDAIEPVLKLMKEKLEEWKEKGMDYVIGRSTMTSHTAKGANRSPRSSQKL